MKVGFIGAGRMGAPMVRRLTAAGHQVTALGRTEEKRAAVAELGAEPAADVPATVGGAEVVVLCVFTDDQVSQLCLQGDLLSAMPRGAVLVLHTTGSPNTAVAVAAHAAKHGVEVLDAPVSGGPHDIAAGQVTLFVGGPATAVQTARPVLDSYGEPVLHVGSIGAGQKVKLINNTLFAAQIGLLSEAAVLAERLGVEESALLSALPHGSGASAALGNVARAGSAAKFKSAVAEFIGKDVAVIRQTLADLGADLGKLDGVVNAALLK